jgi:hypothetical protein
VNENIELTEEDKQFLEEKQQQYPKDFLEKYADNDCLFVHDDIYSCYKARSKISLELVQTLLQLFNI